MGREVLREQFQVIYVYNLDTENVELCREGGATLIFSVELLELKKPSAIPLNRDVLTLFGVVALVGLLIYEAVRRWKRESEDMKQQKKAAKKGSKKKR